MPAQPPPYLALQGEDVRHDPQVPGLIVQVGAPYVLGSTARLKMNQEAYPYGAT